MRKSQTGRQADRQSDIRTGRHTDRQSDRQSNKQTDRQSREMEQVHRINSWRRGDVVILVVLVCRVSC